MHLSDLKHLPVPELVDMAVGDEISNAGRMRKQDLIFAILKNKAKNGDTLFGDGTLEILQDGFGFLRSPEGFICQVLMIFMFLPHKLEGLIFTPAILSKVRLEPQKIVSVISH